jgi:hypothetical protein
MTTISYRIRIYILSSIAVAKAPATLGDTGQHVPLSVITKAPIPYV